MDEPMPFILDSSPAEPLCTTRTPLGERQHEDPYADQAQRYRQRSQDPLRLHMVREPRAELGADEYPKAEDNSPPHPMVKRPGDNVHQCAGQRHHGQGKVGRGCGDMHREMEYVRHHRHMDNATTNA